MVDGENKEFCSQINLIRDYKR